MEINLLPPEQAEIMRLARYGKKVGALMLASFLLTVMVVGYLFYVQVSLRMRLMTLSATINVEGAEEKIQSLKQVEDKMKTIRLLIEKSKELEKAKPVVWSDILRELASFTDENIALATFEVSGDKFEKIKLTGTAKNRDDVIRLKENLENSDYYKEVVSPLSNMTLKEDVAFEFQMTLKTE